MKKLPYLLNIVIAQLNLGVIDIFADGMFFVFTANKSDVFGFRYQVSFQPVNYSEFSFR